AKVAATPFDGHLRVAGTMELSGINTHLDRRRLEAIKRSFERYCRLRPDWARGDEWVGARPITPDGLPLISKLPSFENAYIATGHGMLGVTLAPATADLIADVVDGHATGLNASLFDAARFLE